MEKKAYMMPQLKAWKIEEHLMVTVSGEEIGDDFEEGAKNINLDTDDYQIESKSVWDD